MRKDAVVIDDGTRTEVVLDSFGVRMLAIGGTVNRGVYLIPAEEVKYDDEGYAHVTVKVFVKEVGAINF